MGVIHEKRDNITFELHNMRVQFWGYFIQDKLKDPFMFFLAGGSIWAWEGWRRYRDGDLWFPFLIFFVFARSMWRHCISHRILFHRLGRVFKGIRGRYVFGGWPSDDGSSGGSGSGGGGSRGSHRGSDNGS